jgi:GT2 family glycosyltransferase
MPSISVVIPTLNRQPVLRQTVAWFLNNEAFTDFELIVVDQTDGCDRQLEKLSEQDPRLRHFHVDFQATTRARNFGVTKAQTDVIVFSEDDVVPTEKYLQVYYDYFSTTDGNGATGPVLAPGQRPRSIGELTELERSRLEPDRYLACGDADFAHSAVFGFGGNSAYRRSAILAVGGFDEDYFGNSWGEEYEFSYRFRQRFGSIDFLPEASVVHLAHSSGGSRTLRDGKYVRNFCRNSIYTHMRTGAGWLNTGTECWNLMRRFSINRTLLQRPRPHWIVPVMVGCYDGFMASRLPRKLPLRSPDHEAFTAISADNGAGVAR